MKARKSSSERLERVMSRLAETVLGLSDDEIVTEVSASGRDLQLEAKRVRAVMQRPLQVLENADLCLSNLGHAINPSNWQCGALEYYNTCLHCGLSVSFTIATAEIRGSAVQRACKVSGRAILQTGTLS